MEKQLSYVVKIHHGYPMHKNQEHFFMHINQQANWTTGARKKFKIGPQFFMQINRCFTWCWVRCCRPWIDLANQCWHAAIPCGTSHRSPRHGPWTCLGLTDWHRDRLAREECHRAREEPPRCIKIIAYAWNLCIQVQKAKLSLARCINILNQNCIETLVAQWRKAIVM